MDNTQAAIIYNQAIEDALRKYKNGYAAIAALKKKFVVTVEHEGRSTKQEVKVVDAD